MSRVPLTSLTASQHEAKRMEQLQSGDRIQPQLRLQQQQQLLQPPSQDSLSGKIMLSAIAALFTAIFIVLFFHLYIRWHVLRRARRRRLELLLVGVGDGDDRSPPLARAPLGLDPDLLRSLPIVVRSASDDPIECAVCLSEVEEGEKARILPKCRHGFHVECIDMWFFNHSNCPLCRAAVEAPPPATAQSPKTASAVCDECGSSSSSSGGEMVGLEEPPRRIEELGLGFGSPLERVVSLKRLMSRERRPLYSGRVSNAEADLEIGEGGDPRLSSSRFPARWQASAG